MKILIAGGAGYVGSLLIPRLEERGYDTVVVDLLWFGNHLPTDTKLLQQDVMRVGEEQLSGCDQVVFLAGLSNDPMAEYSPSKNFVSNAAGPAYLAYMAKKAGVRRFIYASSCSIYGYTVNELYDETAPAASSYPYGIAKLQGETACLQLQDADFSVISLRKGTICGYSPRMRLDLVVNTMFKTALEGRRIVVNNPSIWRPILSIQDAVSAYIRAIEASYEISGVFNVASDNYTVGELADHVKNGVEAGLGESIKLEIKDLRDFRNYKVSIAKAMRVLSFKPQDGVEDIVSDLFANLASFEDFGNPLYYNVETFKRLDSEAAEAEAAL